MKTLGFLIGLFVVFTLTAGVEKSLALAGDSQIMTCSGQVAEFGAQNFNIGYSDENGNCGIQSFYANSSGEAYNCAVQACKECRLQDLTGLYQLGSAVPGNNPGEQFCPKQ